MNSQSMTDPEHGVVLAGLNPSANARDIMRGAMFEFSKFGQVKRVRVSQETLEEGYAFVVFEEQAHAEVARQHFKNGPVNIEGWSLQVLFRNEFNQQIQSPSPDEGVGSSSPSNPEGVLPGNGNGPTINIEAMQGKGFPEGKGMPGKGTPQNGSGGWTPNGKGLSPNNASSGGVPVGGAGTPGGLGGARRSMGIVNGGMPKRHLQMQPQPQPPQQPRPTITKPPVATQAPVQRPLGAKPPGTSYVQQQRAGLIRPITAEFQPTYQETFYPQQHQQQFMHPNQMMPPMPQEPPHMMQPMEQQQQIVMIDQQGQQYIQQEMPDVDLWQRSHESQNFSAFGWACDTTSDTWYDDTTQLYYDPRERFFINRESEFYSINGNLELQQIESTGEPIIGGKLKPLNQDVLRCLSSPANRRRCFSDESISPGAKRLCIDPRQVMAMEPMPQMMQPMSGNFH